MRRLDIGIASFRKTDRLRAALGSLIRHSETDWRCFVVDNASGPDTKEIIAEFAARDSRIVPVWLEENIGYAGAVNRIFELAETEYIAYLDDDAEIFNTGWDEKLCGYLDRFHEIGWICPNGGAYMMDRGPYQEVMWAPGFCWVISRLCMKDTGPMDTSLGHQEEADLALRIRLAGYKCAAAPEIKVAHHATATNDPAAIERINRGIIRWMDKWVAFFCGKNFNYHSPNVLRWDDWPPNALYLEEWWKAKLPGLNDNPEVITAEDREYDLIRVPRYKGYYRGRII